MTNESKFALSITLLVLGGCMVTSEVQQVDRDTYVVSTSTGAGGINNQKLMIASATKATEFCAKSGLDMVRAQSLLSHTGYDGREFMFNFRCVAKASTTSSEGKP